jgi:hypothetical protein
VRQIKSRKSGKLVPRSGIAAIWLIGSAAMIVAAMSLVLEIGWLNLCRAEVKVVAESAALAAARSWGLAATDDAPARTTSKTRARTIVTGSQVDGSPTELLALDAGLAASNNAAAVNNNASCPSLLPAVNTLILMGDFDPATKVLNAGVSPAASARRACLVQFTVTLTSPFTAATRTVKARAVAVWDSAASPARSRLVGVSSITCP